MRLETPVLVIGAHADDGELSCGGTMCTLALGNPSDVHYFVFSAPANPEKGQAGYVELGAAAKLLGVANVQHAVLPRRAFPERRQEILDVLVGMREVVKPRTVLVPWYRDFHQDHEVVHKEAMRAFKQQDVLGYEQTWNTPDFHPSMHFELSEGALQSKVEALRCYVSQKDRPYMAEDVIRGWARFRGAQAGVKYAEAFAVMRSVGRA